MSGVVDAFMWRMMGLLLLVLLGVIRGIWTLALPHMMQQNRSKALGQHAGIDKIEAEKELSAARLSVGIFRSTLFYHSN